MEILFNIESNTYSQEITLKLPIIKKTSQNNYIESGPMTQIANLQPAQIENNTNPIIMGVSGPRNDENDYPLVMMKMIILIALIQQSLINKYISLNLLK